MTAYNNIFTTHTATILNGQTTSDSIDLQGRGLVGLILPAAFTGSAITFQMSLDGSTFYNVYNAANTQLSMTVTQGRAYLFNPGDLLSVRYIKLVSGSSEGGNRSITLIARDLS